MAGTFKLNPGGFQRLRQGWALRLDDLNERILETQKELAPVGKDRGSKGGRRGKQVTVELTPDGPRLAKGSHKSASASRYIKTKKVSELTPIPDRPGFYTYTFERHRPGTLRRSGRVIAVDEIGPVMHGGTEFTAPYAIYVEKGTRTQAGQHYMVRGLEAHRDEIEDGDFLKG